jgi:hypothetical protein
MIDSLVTGMGGAGGVLASFGGILLHTFSPQITKNIREIGYNLSAHMPGFRDKKGAEKSAVITEMNDII